ncbi:MAG: hypothetical protein U1G05_00250 [Kiritimatiellia bacterium]
MEQGDPAGHRGGKGGLLHFDGGPENGGPRTCGLAGVDELASWFSAHLPAV